MKVHIIIVLIFLNFNALAQKKYGNEWIKTDQPYAKIKISEKGVYKITYLQLMSLGFIEGNPNPKKIQLYYLGEEVFLNIVGEQDGTFDPNDYIEFYAAPNNGKFDTSLYKNGEQPNEEVSLFSDDANYFLTISKNNFGKRLTATTLNNANLTPETYIVFTSSLNFGDAYYPGLYVLDVMTFSDYIEGEGYLGSTFSLGISQNRSISTPNFVNSTNFKTNFQSFVAGRSNASSTNAQGNNHHLNISLGNTVLKDTLYRGYKTVRINQTINNITLNSNTDIKFSSINDIGSVTDFQAVGYFRVSYPRNLDAQNFTSLSFKLNNTNQSCLLNFSNTNRWVNPRIIDPLIGKIFIPTQTGNNTSISVENSNQELYLYNEDSFKSVTLEKVTFNYLDANNYTAKMLLVTHPSLLSEVNDLANYKNSLGITTAVITTDQIYNQFSYGIHHPLGIRNLARYLIEQAKLKPQYLFLIGKGYETPKGNLDRDLVPTMGFPASDNEFTAKIIDNNLAPALATGRLPAKTPTDVKNYLEKLILFNNQPNVLWRKTIINITGGGNSSEDVSFANSLKNLSNISNNDLFGSKTITYYKNIADPITTNLTAKINSTIAEGANLVTYLGHGSTTGTAVSVGKASDLDRILFFFINGCSTGNVFTSSSLAEEFILEKQKGAIGWIGTSSEGVASYLSNLGLNLYQNSFKNNYGKSVSQNISASIRAFQNQNDALNHIHCQQYMYIGDPSVSFYSPDKPDYEITSKDISILEDNVTANSSNFNLSLIIKNKGKALNNTVKINVKRILGDNSEIEYPSQSYSNLFNTDTVKFFINNDVLKKDGNNKFIISIDPQNEISEINEQNNTSEFSYLFASNGLSIIYPNEYSILSNTDVVLKIQANNLFTKQASYYFEIDTLPTFDSQYKKISASISSSLFAAWKPNMALSNNKVYYWRARIDLDPNDGGQWKNSSFTYINGSSDGWSQAHIGQFTNVYLKNIKNDFTYTSNAYPIQVRTRGQQSTSFIERKIRLGSANGSAAFNSSEFEGFGIIALDPINYNKRFNYPSVYNFKNNGVDGTGMFLFNTNNTSDLDSLINYIKNIPKSYNIIGLSGANFNPKNFNQTVLNSFKSLGLTVLETVENGEPYVFVTQKGAQPFANFTKEVKASNSEEIVFLYDLSYPWTIGDYVSEEIGPAKSWGTANINLASNSNDVITTSVIGINNNGVETILNSNAGYEVNISNINAETYPFIKLKVNAQDNTDFTLAKLKYWNATFEKFPEASFNTLIKDSFISKEIAEGDSLKIGIGISNLKLYTTDSLIIKYKITKQDRGVIIGKIKTLAPLKQNENEVLDFKIDTKGYVGNNTLQLNLVPKSGLDQLEFNNYISYNYNVTKDEKAPLIDVAFDGKHITNGETVSPKPSITISVLDENKFLLLKDTSAIKVFLKKSEDGNYERLSFSSNKITLQNIATSENNKANFIVQPGLLEDGIYNLKVIAVDKSGNSSGSDLLTSFEVINEQSISNFLPYPNPVTNTTRFVFKVTGEKIPDKIKIQIMTVSGKIVREVSQQELGNIHIGNNISDFIWDGTDTYGDRLANGIYFYKVTVQNNDGSTVKSNYNVTDKMFKNNMGKIYLMK